MLLLVAACSASSGAGQAVPLPTPTDTTTQTYLRACLSPDGMVRGFLAADVDPSTVTAVLRCTPDLQRRAVRVEVARGDAGQLVSSLRSGDDTATGAPRRTTYVIVGRDGSTHAVTPSAPAAAAALTAARFAVVGTTPIGSLDG